MISPPRRRLAACIFVLAIAAAAGGCDTRPVFASAGLTVVSANGRWDYRVEVARNEQQRRLGLMYRETLGRDHGMLLWFPRAQRCGIWMKNTLIPLDILYIDPTGHIVKVAAGAKPLSTRIIDSGTPVRAVLEINGGQAAQRGIRSGDRIIYGPWGAPAGRLSQP